MGKLGFLCLRYLLIFNPSGLAACKRQKHFVYLRSVFSFCGVTIKAPPHLRRGFFIRMVAYPQAPGLAHFDL